MKPFPLDLAKFKEKLLALREELRQIEQTGNDAAQVVELDQSRVGRVSRMDAMQAQAMSLEAKRRRMLQVQRVDSALQRIEKETYGLCIKCHEEIVQGRLEFDPTTLVCIDCARA